MNIEDWLSDDFEYIYWNDSSTADPKIEDWLSDDF